jgi:glycosyltransferase involved in cell wall biosynthesis
VIYASEWSRQWAIDAYGLAPERVHVIPFGANIESAPSDDEFEAMLTQRRSQRWRLLFLGVEWERKGGDIAFGATEELRRRGIDAELVVLGTAPPAEVPRPDWLTVLGYVSKSTAAGREAIADELRRAHLLVLPTRAEAYGIAFCEASAFGLPSVAPRTGGIPSIIRDGRNGRLVEPDADAELYADVVEDVIRGDAWEALCRSSRAEYDARLNWDAAAARALAVIRDAVDQRNGGGRSMA